MHNALVTRTVKWLLLTAAAAFSGVGLVWALTGEAPSAGTVARFDTLASLLATVGLPISVLGLWAIFGPKSDSGVSEEELNAAASHLAKESEIYWRAQASSRGITAPIPAAVRWRWASADVAAAAIEIQPGGEPFSEGTVTRLGTELYDRLPADRSRMVIVGPPGSGKTGALLLLIVDVL